MVNRWYVGRGARRFATGLAVNPLLNRIGLERQR